MDSKHALALVCSLSVAGCALDTDDVDAHGQALDQSSSALCKSALSPAQEKLALELIDDICGDTWCEGDNNFAFDRLTCQSGAPRAATGGSCTLRLRILPRDDSHRAYSRSCTTGGFSGFESLVDTAQSGYQSLDWDYYLALTDCISRLEAALPR